MTPILLTVVLAVVLAVALLLAGRFLADLRPVPRGVLSRGGAAVSVVVPARNEAATIGVLLGSLRHLHT
ncbi:hypothetical protein, partial [Xanthobacter autotrophicus]|uniref:hypothetical protein n=1 Tax=Xanthobacter autotrophicus TaxID=280 RepID=UPI0024ABB787|nr:hypothetical protein [Xanthobacter autotrophicus]